MKTLESVWLDFYQKHQAQLEVVYPGLSQRRFLLDLLDILKFRSSVPNLSLSQSKFSLSPKLTLKLEEEFLKGTPFAYMMGFSEFYLSKFYVNENVLIPRPETEYMVELIVQEFKDKVQDVLDVGVGSGAILLSLLKCGVGKYGVGVDISPQALEVTQTNARRLRLNPELLLSDRLSKVTGRFDLIVSNPPYIKESSHRQLVQQSVHDFEPHTALYLPDVDYEKWFREFFTQIKAHLSGTFMMEGHELEVHNQAQLLIELGYDHVQVIKDLSGRDRFLKAFKSSNFNHT